MRRKPLGKNIYIDALAWYVELPAGLEPATLTAMGALPLSYAAPGLARHPGWS